MDAKTFVIAGVVACVGVALVLLGTDIIPLSAVKTNVPDWMLVVIGLALILTAGSVYVRTGSLPIAARLVGISLLLMALAFAWIALFGDPRQMRGGIPFLPDVYNGLLGRFMFGVGALLFLGLGFLALRHAKDRPVDEGIESDS